MFCGLVGSGFQKHISRSMNASWMISWAKPKDWKVSTLRAWMPSAWPISRRPGRRSISRVLTSGYWDSWAAAITPAGPEPTMSTSMVSGRSSGRSIPCPRASSIRGSSVTYPFW